MRRAQRENPNADAAPGGEVDALGTAGGRRWRQWPFPTGTWIALALTLVLVASVAGILGARLLAPVDQRVVVGVPRTDPLAPTSASAATPEPSTPTSVPPAPTTTAAPAPVAPASTTGTPPSSSPTRNANESNEAVNGPTGDQKDTSRAPATPNGVRYNPSPFVGAVPLPAGTLTVLLIGSDARPGEDPLRCRGDSLHVVTINPRTGAGTILGIPRDTWVDLPGLGPSKINAALALGGPDAMTGAVQRLTGLKIDYYVVAGFAGFTALIDDNGGLTVDVDRPMADKNMNAYYQPGRYQMDGARALEFSRARYGVSGGDFGRSHNHGQVVVSSVRKLRAETNDVAGLEAVVARSLRHLTFNAGPADAVRLLGAARAADPDALRNVVLAGSVGTAKGQSVVFVDQPFLQRTVAEIRAQAAA